MDFVLASNSPRRKDILSKAGYSFKVEPSRYDEKICGLEYSDVLVENCAYQKALEVQKRTNEKRMIVSCDTVVVCDGKILGKPHDEIEAFEMLKSLSAKTHFVASAICILKEDKKLCKTDKTFVEFRELGEDEIKKYIKEKNPLDKAGSYGIQDEGFDFALGLKGEIDNVIGFPLKLFEGMVRKI